jgi:hypothetical protein
MKLDEARRLMKEQDTSDPARALEAVAAVVRHYGLADARLRAIADNVQKVADELAAESKP